MSGFQKALPIGLAVFCGVIGGIYTFQPVLAPKGPPGEGRDKSTQTTPETKAAGNPPPVSKK
ncbi:acid protease [Purpureocillium lavendulum]|uniref:Acid protease n=1 Tax=Purpureocillium lavendulum TaxID=1247861 RepID=A0AB34FPM0_9HYPO|nr:acid protease [Purpureocillium lavendulum]